MTKSERLDDHILRSFDTAFVPYATAIGFLVREWNSLQEQFCDLFCTVMEPTQYAVSSSVWYAIQNDRLQRTILLAVASKRLTTPPQRKCLENIKWAICRANSLGSQRDDTIHSPFAMMLAEPFEFVSKYFTGHPRAQALKNKKLLVEFELYRQNAIILRRYLSQMGFHLHLLLRDRPSEELPPLPEKPQLLTSLKKNKGKSL